MSSTNVALMKRVGILGGASDQATADYYRRFNKAVNDRFGDWNTAELLISSMNFAFSRYCAQHERWDEMGAYLSERAVALESAGADLIICVSNTLHRVADVFTSRLKIPFIHIVDPTADAIKAADLKCVGLLGTKATMTGSHIKGRYADRLGIEIVVPEPDDQDMIDGVIFNELCRGMVSPRSKASYLEIIDRLGDQGVEGVILGCTEIPLLIGQADRPALPLFDTAGLHVAAAINLATRDC
ncbi:MAG TPA: amino acid racemase [Candidatus Binatia bacterium]|nr:amino acid racemase [Candidatus Binatia bacterium]